MRKIVAVLALRLFSQAVDAAVVAQPPSEAARSSPSADRLEGFDESIAGYMKEWKVPGLAIVVVHDGEVIHMKGYGYRDVERKLPVTTKTRFGIGSITKSFAAVTLGILVDEGRLDWDRPVREYLPDFRLYDPVATDRTRPGI